MNKNIERISYLTRKGYLYGLSRGEQSELATLLGCNPEEFKEDNGLNLLIVKGLVAMAVNIIMEIIDAY
jgi:hypothetical protein